MDYGDESIIAALMEEGQEQRKNIYQQVKIDGIGYVFEQRSLPFGFSMMLPSQLDIMEPEQAKRKYLMEDRPQYICTADNTSVNICFDLLPATTTDM